MSSLSFLHTDTTNYLLVVEGEDISSPNNATINCTFLSGFTGSAHCTVQYGTDPTFMNLPYFAGSTESGTAGDSVSVVLKEQLNSSTVYYYTVSAVSGDITVIVQATFTTPQYSMHNVLMWYVLIHDGCCLSLKTPCKWLVGFCRQCVSVHAAWELNWNILNLQRTKKVNLPLDYRK